MKEILLKQNNEYQSFLQNLEKLISDYCLLTKKYNPSENYDLGDDLSFEIKEDELYLYWEETSYPCGECSIEYKNLRIPLDFYENTKNIELEFLKKEEKKKQIQEKIKDLQKELNKVSDNIISFNKDKKLLLLFNARYLIKLDEKEMDKGNEKNINERDKLLKEIEKLREELECLD